MENNRTTTAHISIAMCTFNGARYLGDQLESLRTQTLLPDELIVCDDGSTDQGLEIIESFIQTAPFPVRVFVNEQTLGPAKNFERAIGLCRGELIALCDQDDSWYPQKLERLSSVLAADGTLRGVFSDAFLMDENSVCSSSRLWESVRFHPPSGYLRLEQPLAAFLLKSNVVTGATLMIRASAREFVLPVPLPWMHDGWIAWMLVLHSGIAAVAEPLISYRIHQAQHAGVSPNSLWRRVEIARQTGRRECLTTARQFEELRAHMLASPGHNNQDLLSQVQEKIQHLHYRLKLPHNIVSRAWRIATAWKQYCRYANGPATMLKDLLVP